MTFEEWCGGRGEWIIDSSTMRFARAAWEAAIQAERELAKKVLNSQSEAHIRNLLQAAVEAERTYTEGQMKLYADMCVKAEREACAKIADEFINQAKRFQNKQGEAWSSDLAVAIRARSKKP